MNLSPDAASTGIAGKRILIFRPYGISINHFAIEQAVCGQLGLLGAKVSWLVCNGIYPECDRHWQVVDRNDKKNACTRCVGHASHIRNQFGLDMAGLGSHLAPTDFALVEQWLAGLDPAHYPEAELQGWALGAWAKSSVNTHLRCAEIILSDPTHCEAYRAYLRSAALTALALKHYLDISKVDAVFMMNARTAASRTVFEIARSLSIPVAVHEFGKSEETRFLFMNETCLSMKGWNQHWDTWGNIPLSTREIQQTCDFLEARLTGAVDYSYNKNNTISVSQLIQQDSKRKIVSLFTSSTDEISSSEDWEWPFTQIEWMREVVKYFKARPEYVLVIRCHPNHDHAFFGRDYQFLDALATLDVTGLDNIRIVMPTEKVDSYDLLRASDATLIFASTIGVEASLLGIKTMLAGCGRYQGRQLACQYTDGNLANLPAAMTEFLDNPFDEQWRINAARWLYLWAVRYVYEVPLVKRNGSQVECLPEAFTTLKPHWRFLDDIVRFFTGNGQAFEPSLPPASIDAAAFENERLAVARSFESLAARTGKVPALV